jgi:hypothetical protein
MELYVLTIQLAVIQIITPISFAIVLTDLPTISAKDQFLAIQLHVSTTQLAKTTLI